MLIFGSTVSIKVSSIWTLFYYLSFSSYFGGFLKGFGPSLPESYLVCESDEIDFLIDSYWTFAVTNSVKSSLLLSSSNDDTFFIDGVLTSLLATILR